MKIKSTIQQSVTVLALVLVSACSGGAGGGNNQNTRERVTSQSVAQTVSPLFNSVNGGFAALKAQESSSACLDEDVSEDGLSLSNDVPEGHYGLADEGLEFSSDAACAETGFLHWELEDATGEDCAGEEMAFSGEGIVGVGTSDAGEEVVIILGTFTIEGLEVTCDIIVTASSFDASCEVDGELIDSESCGAEDDESEDESDDESEDESDDETDDESDDESDDEDSEE